VVTLLGLVGLIALIAANGYFVAAEFSFVAARRGRLEERAKNGDRRAARAVEVHQRLSFMLSGAQLGITVTSLIVGFIAEPTLGRALEPVLDAVGVPEAAQRGLAVSVGFVLATGGQMVLGELAPKNLAIARAEPVARWLAGSLLLFLRLGSPLIRLFDGAANRLLRTVGIEPVEELAGGVSVEELDLIVEESAQQGTLTPSQAALLERALDFGELHASSVMVAWKQVVSIGVTATGEDLRDVMAGGHSRFPVVGDDGAVTGIVDAKDLLGIPTEAMGTVSVGELSRPALVVPETTGLRVVLERLRQEPTEMALVVDEYGAPAGVLTLEDLVEELVGDIADEHDPYEPGARREPSGSWLVPGSWRPDEIQRATGLALPEGSYDTVAGLVLSHLERLAEAGDRVEIAGTTVEVVAVDGWTITQVQLVAVAEPDDTTSETSEVSASDPADETNEVRG
jgi:CBS domain containing-hemolysin-like protein